MFTGKPEHIKGFDYLGPRQYFLTFCTHSRRRCFVTDDAVAIVRTQIERATAEQDIAVLAYCYMPDHAHFLAEGKRRIPTVCSSSRGESSFPGTTTKRSLVTVCGSDTVTSTHFGVTRRQSVSLATFSRIPYEQDWLRASMTMRSRDRACTRSSRSSTRFNCGRTGTAGPPKGGHDIEVRRKPDTTPTRASLRTRATA
jgi:REP element-mobilizing transposase RayT